MNFGPTTTCSLLDLPGEILLSIFEATYQEGYLSRFDVKPVSHFTALCLVCSSFYKLLLPSIWRNVLIQDLTSLLQFHAALYLKPERSSLVRVLAFEYDTRKFGGDDAAWSDPDIIRLLDPLRYKVQKPASIQEIVQSILSMLTGLQCLYMSAGPTYTEIKIAWSFDLNHNRDLRDISICHHRCSPITLESLLNMPLEKLYLMLRYDEDMWNSYSVPSITSKIKQLWLYWSSRPGEYRKIESHGVPNRVVRGILSCLDDTQTLNLTILPDAFESGLLNEVLCSRTFVSTLRSLRLGTHAPMLSKRLEIDFSKWLQLERLTLDSVMLWPLRDSWHMRHSLYKTLPASLKTLVIEFPNQLDSDFGTAPFDGVFQMNTNVKQAHRYLKDQTIPESRYTWFSNLLKYRDEKNARREPYLPALEDIHVSEFGIYDSAGWPLSCERSSLPEPMSSQFQQRNITVHYWCIDYEAELRYEEELRYQEELEYREMNG